MSSKSEAVGLQTVTEARLDFNSISLFGDEEKASSAPSRPPVAQRKAPVERDIGNTRYARLGRIARLGERSSPRRGMCL